MNFLVGLDWAREAKPVHEECCGRLEARPEISPKVWGDDPERRRIAREVCSVAKETMMWPNDRLMPEDPVAVAFWCYYDGLDYEEARMDLEDRLGIKITDEDLISAYKGTMSEFVNLLKDKVSSNG